MQSRVTATFINGVFKPDENLPLTDQTRVRLTIEPIEEWSPEKALAAWERIKARLKEHPLNFGGVRYSRDELYESR
jgi:predicted DNA-binding antitoxin AbrB/MazE fold protein